MTAPQLAKRMKSVRPSPTAVISEKVRSLRLRDLPVINLGEGELDFATPEHIARAGIEAIEKGFTKYTAVAGVTELRDAIARKFRRENAIEYSESEVIAGSGAKQLIFNAFLATLDAGDEVLVPSPYWVSYPDMVSLAEAEPRFVACHPEDGWKLRPGALEAAITPKTRWLILNSPNNPTGAVYSAKEISALTDVVLRHPRLMVLADDIYEHTRYVADFATPASVEPRLKNRTLTVNGVSKAYSMTGWRIGYAGGPDWLIEAMQILQSQSTSNPCSISQMAAVAALEAGPSFIQGWLRILASRRDRVLEMVDRVDGMSSPSPQGAFYVFADCRGLFGKTIPAGKRLESDVDVAEFLLDSAYVATLPGSAFGTPGFLRIAYAIDNATLDDACTRIEHACGTLIPAAASMAA